MSSSASRRARAAEEKAAKRLNKESIVLEFDYSPGSLRHHGPVINTSITITKDHRDALVAAGAPVPTPVMCRFLIDTGAHGCVVKHEIAQRAGLKLIQDNTPLHGVGVDTSGKTYIGRVLFGAPSRVMAGAMHNVYVDTQVISGNLETDLFEGLIGRDVLQHFVLTYDGRTGRVTMKYQRPPANPSK